MIKDKIISFEYLPFANVVCYDDCCYGKRFVTGVAYGMWVQLAQSEILDL